MLLSDIEPLVRQDLFDPGATRWSSGDVQRAIERAVAHYSLFAPHVAYADMTTQPNQRTYPFPTSWHPSFPALWIEKVFYPLQIAGTQLAAPASAAVATPGAGSGLGIGSYSYVVTFLTAGGETTAGPVSSAVTTSGNQRVSLGNLPLGPSGTTSNSVIGRSIYRTQAGGGAYSLLTSIADNTTTSWLDSVSDSQLASMPALSQVNTSGIMVWPPREHAFAEYSEFADGRYALGRGGNMGPMGVAGSASTKTMAPSFTLLLSTSLLPVDSSAVMRVFYATRHQLDSSGSTVPEAHRDIIVMGALAYAMQAYQVPTNDNFAFQDGNLHDRLDDTAIPAAWSRAASEKMRQFVERLETLGRNRSFAGSARLFWGGR
jgi:hypothetical protein